MKIFSDSFTDGHSLPGEYAFAVADNVSHLRLSSNRNPHLAWSDLPAGTRSLVLVCHDPDVPSVGDNVNQEGKTLSASLPRVDFCHWLLLDIPATVTSLAAGSHSAAVTARGKNGPEAPQGLRHGINDYTAWFASDENMRGHYFGYDGPCPPWNDELMHHYIFTLYALPSEALTVQGELNYANVTAALAATEVLGHARITGLYSLNPALHSQD